jgi:hypothetical protein
MIKLVYVDIMQLPVLERKDFQMCSEFTSISIIFIQSVRLKNTVEQQTVLPSAAENIQS